MEKISVTWTFLKKIFERTLPFISKWLCEKLFPANPSGLIIQWRAPRITMDRKTTNPKIDCYVSVHNFIGYSIKIENIELWISSILKREKHNIAIKNAEAKEIHFQDSLTDGEYRALFKSAQYKRSDMPSSNISDVRVGIHIQAVTSIGTQLDVRSTEGMSTNYVVVDEVN